MQQKLYGITDQFEMRCRKCRRDRPCPEYHRLPDLEITLCWC